MLREIAFEDGASVCVISVWNGVTELIFDELDDLFQQRWNDIVIVVAESIGGNAECRMRNAVVGERGIRNCQN